MTAAVVETRTTPRLTLVRSLFFGSLSGTFGSILLIVTVGTALLGPTIAPHKPYELVGPPRQTPSGDHLLGTDQIGRDLLSRVLHGGVDAVTVPMLATLLAFGVGAGAGMWAGYVGGRGDQVTSRTVDVLIALPPLLLAIVAISAFGSSPALLIVVTAIFFIPRVVRVIRGTTAAVATSDYVTASRIRGDSTSEIVRRDVMPNISGILVVEFAARLSNVIIFIATLNFLGLGAQPPSSSWGLMVSETTLLLRSNPLAALVPAALIAALAVSVNLLADQLAAHLARDQQAMSSL